MKSIKENMSMNPFLMAVSGLCLAVAQLAAVQTPPAITSIAPPSALPGANVVISGSNFSPVPTNNVVYFGAVRADVLAATETILTVIVPPGATCAPITETVDGLTAYSGQFFTPTFPGGGRITANSLAPRVNLPAGNGPIHVAIADLDADGKPDLIMTDTYSGELSIYRNIITSGSLTTNSFEPRIALRMREGRSSDPWHVVAADVDGDGKLDLIASDADNNLVSIFRNTSTPGNLTTNSFAERVDLPGGGAIHGLAVRDLNGDGKPEIVAARGDNKMAIFQNQSTVGSVSFAVPVTFAAGSNPNGVAIGDLNGDGFPDIAIGNYGGGSVSIFRNLATGGDITTDSFASKVDLTTLSEPSYIGLGDVDGDAKLDLIVPHYAGRSFSIFRNQSEGESITFAARVDYALPAGGFNMALGDLDGDGKVDLAGASATGLVSLFDNESSPGAFTASSFVGRVDFRGGSNPRGTAVGDLDGDGRPDVVVANCNDNTISIYRNAAQAPQITSFTPTSGLAGTHVTITGFNFSPLAMNNAVYFGAARATVIAATETSLTVIVPAGATYAPISETINGLTAQSDQAFMPTFPGGNPISANSLAPRVDLAAGNGPIHVVIADLDGDGKPDLIMTDTYAGELSICRNISASGSLTAASFEPRIALRMRSGIASDPWYVAAADVDGDGKLDLVAADGDNNVVSIFRNISSPGSLTPNSFAQRVDLPGGASIHGLAVRDLNGDGKPEIVAARADNNMAIFQNQSSLGSVSFGAPVAFATGNYPNGVAIGDLNGDGLPDIVVGNYSGASISIFRNLGTNGDITTNCFAPEPNLTTLSEPAYIGLADIDADGKLDLIVPHYASGTLSLFRNASVDGSISFAAGVDYPLGGGGHNMALGDLDGDGKVDLAGGSAMNLLSIFDNGSSPGVLSTMPRVDFLGGANAWGTAVGDLDGDGRPDVVLANNNENTISIYRNLAPTVTRTAVGTARVENGTVADLTLTDTGYGYTNAAPAVLLLGGGGTGATAEAIINNGAVVGIRITNGGAGYTNAPRVYIYSPFGVQLGILKAVRPSFSDLLVGKQYQLQISSDSVTWTNEGLPFEAVTPVMAYPQFWDVDNASPLFFRVQAVP